MTKTVCATCGLMECVHLQLNVARGLESLMQDVTIVLAILTYQADEHPDAVIDCEIRRKYEQAIWKAAQQIVEKN